MPGKSEVPLGDSVEVQVAKLDERLKSHLDDEERWQKRIEGALKDNSRCHADIKKDLLGTSKGITKILAMITVLLVLIPTVTGLLVYIFRNHNH